MNARILLTATGSGCGKTTITIALLKALSMKGFEVSSFKCGPDYIDPMYHKKTLGIPTYNLDPFFCDKKNICEVLSNGLSKSDIGIIEGVMGYYDGYGPDGKASTWDVADATNTPAILIVNAKGMGNSVGAIIRGFKKYKENNHIKGVIFNNISKEMYPMYARIAKAEGVIPLGYMKHNEDVSIKSRHLGLITADELKDILIIIDTLGKMAIESLDIDRIIEIARESADLDCFDSIEESDNIFNVEKVKVAIAKDDAFCFIYQENIDLLEKLGCEIVFFSPLLNEKIPEGCCGLYLPGGYPELYAKKLSKNKETVQSIKEAIEKGLPTIAECGGYMYLHEKIEEYEMVGIIKGKVTKQSRLVRFGYGTMNAKEDGLLLKKNDSIRIHEFHYFDSENNGKAFNVIKASNGVEYDCGYSTDTLYAGYPHLYFRANNKVAENFVEAMKAYKD